MDSMEQQLSRMNEMLLQTSQRILELGDQIIQLQRQLGTPEKTWFPAAETAQTLNTSEQNLACWREMEQWDDGSLPWIEGIHYQRLPVARPRHSSGVPKRSTAPYCYNLKLLMHWFDCRGDLPCQQRAANDWKKKQSRRSS